MNRLFAVVNVLGKLVLIFGLTMLIPLGLALWSNDGTHVVFGKSIVVTLGSGLIMSIATQRFKRELQTMDGFLLVVLVWSALPAFAMLPLLLQLPELNLSMAYFEAASGLTATGSRMHSSQRSLRHVFEMRLHTHQTQCRAQSHQY